MEKTRKRTIVIMLLPLIILLWIVGWTLFWAGSEKQPKTTQTTSKTDGIEITTPPLEEIEA